MVKRIAVLAAIAALVLGVAPSRAADIVENPIGSIKLVPGTNQVVIKTGDIAGARWFGARIFTVPPGRLTSHTKLYTTKTAYSYTGNASGMSDQAGKILCISDFGGTGSPTGGIAGSGGGTFDDQADQGIAMIGGFVGDATGCTQNGVATGSQDIVLTFDAPGQISFAFYGAFWGTEAAGWRSDAGNTSGNKAWWNLWGNFTDLGYGSTQ